MKLYKGCDKKYLFHRNGIQSHCSNYVSNNWARLLWGIKEETNGYLMYIINFSIWKHGGGKKLVNTQSQTIIFSYRTDIKLLTCNVWCNRDEEDCIVVFFITVKVVYTSICKMANHLSGSSCSKCG